MYNYSLEFERSMHNDGQLWNFALFPVFAVDFISRVMKRDGYQLVIMIAATRSVSSGLD